MKRKIDTRSLVISAVLTALSIVITRLLSLQITPELRIGFGPLPIILVGIMYGPFLGALSGLTADLVGIMITLLGAFHPGFTLSAVLTGLLPGLVSYFFFKEKTKSKETLTIGLSVLLVYGFVHLILNSIWVNGLYGTPIQVLITGKFLKVIIEGAITFILLKVVYSKVLKKMLQK